MTYLKWLIVQGGSSEWKCKNAHIMSSNQDGQNPGIFNLQNLVLINSSVSHGCWWRWKWSWWSFFVSLNWSSTRCPLCINYHIIHCVGPPSQSGFNWPIKIFPTNGTRLQTSSQWLSSVCKMFGLYKAVPSALLYHVIYLKYEVLKYGYQ